MNDLKAHVYDLKGEVAGEILLPQVFTTPLRPIVIKRAFLAQLSKKFQPQGRDPMAGKRTTAESIGVGHGVARVARIKGGMRAALIPFAVGGRTTHPPTPEKKIVKRIPKKEKRLALFSAIAATASKELVAARGHLIDQVLEIPVVAISEVEKLRKTREVKETFMNLGLWPDVLRVKKSRKLRAGRGKMRGRAFKEAVGPLIVVKESDGIERAARNLPGVDVVRVTSLNVGVLAPGSHPGRLTLWSSSAIEELQKLTEGLTK
ncbi:50S ribosomal protein L4 [Candidatus Bathyarchaeota archaeon]|nr:50S ribosomal protein L4 [Candidatus Bathyarchaeota archaeon]